MVAIGQTLAHYKIVQKLGQGGMGEVYQATDLKLGRDVALKVLPEEFARDADRVARFQREAKLLASLNHPNIAAIHGLEESGGTHFLVLELVPGETLADQIKRGPIPVEEALKLALQIAEALEAAHEKGVIHRDLKTANIKVTPEGKVKVLDFGLAKAFAGDRSELNSPDSPTLSLAATRQGVILGTAAYMSPEQARGETVDKRADIWAFGCVLFEMMTGRGTFDGRTVSDVLASVLKSEPDWSRLPPNLHWRLREVIGRCLNKESKDRYHDIADVRVDIQNVLADPDGVSGQPVREVEPQSRLRLVLPWVAAAVILGAIIAGVAVWHLKPEPEPELRPVSRFSYLLPQNQTIYAPTGGMRSIAISPDGRQFGYNTTAGFFLRSMHQLQPRLLVGPPEMLINPVFSPDGQWLAYFSVGNPGQGQLQLKKIAVSGGSPVTLCSVQLNRGASWNADNAILFDQPTGVMRVSGNGGTPELILEGRGIAAPQMLPDGKTILFTSGPVSGNPQIAVQAIGARQRKVLFPGQGARYLPTGHLVYGIGKDIFAVPFDPEKLETTGGPVPLVESIYGGLNLGAMQYGVANSGTLVYVESTAAASSAASENTSLVWVDRNGKEEPIDAPPNAYALPKISPDGTKVAVITLATRSDIWIFDLVHKTLTRLTFNEGDNTYPIWSLDGKRIAYESDTESTGGIYWKAADGTGKEDLLGSPPTGWKIHGASWSGDGKALAVTAQQVDTRNADIGIIPLEGDRKFKPLLSEKFREANPQISPDGRYMAYVSDESGKNEVYVRPFPDVDSGRWQISANGGSNPLWSRDGREVFCSSGGVVTAVPVKTTPALSLGTPKVLFRMAPGLGWDISPDGKRFLMVKRPAATGQTSGADGPRTINIVLNWLEELKQRVPTGKR
jgi:serine/threonine protein kinase/Tol biopolymer transport system component